MCGLPEPFHSADTPIAFIHAKPPSPRYAPSPGIGLSGGSGGASTISARRSLRSGNHSRSLDNTSLSGVWGSYGAHSRSYTLVDTSIPSSWSYTLTRSPSSAVTHDAHPRRVLYYAHPRSTLCVVPCMPLIVAQRHTE